MKLTTVIITFNEERNIGRCLQSVEDIADEVVVVDSYSTDRTKEICEKFGVRFFQQEFHDYASQKNYAISLATGDYILSLDADEQISPKLKEEILKVKEKTTAQAYSFNRMTNYCLEKWIKHCGWYPDVALRLVKKELAVFKGEFVHEGILLDPNIEVVHLKGDLYHYSYYSTEEHIERVNKYSTLGAKKYLTKKKRKITCCDIVCRTFWTFFRSYFLKLGFLDGWAGYKVCYIMSLETFIKYTKVQEMQRKHSK